MMQGRKSTKPPRKRTGTSYAEVMKTGRVIRYFSTAQAAERWTAELQAAGMAVAIVFVAPEPKRDCVRASIARCTDAE